MVYKNCSIALRGVGLSVWDWILVREGSGGVVGGSKPQEFRISWFHVAAIAITSYSQVPQMYFMMSICLGLCVELFLQVDWSPGLKWPKVGPTCSV